MISINSPDSSAIIVQNNKMFAELKSLNLPLKEYAITGSGPMGIRGLRKIADIDIIVTMDLWNTLSLKYRMVDDGLTNKIEISNNIDAFNKDSFYSIIKSASDPKFEERIKTAELIQGLPFESLDFVIYFKRKMNRDKDIKDIKAIECWLLEHNNK